MKKCPNCNRTFGDDYKFCLMDGTALTPDPGGPQPSGEIPAQYVPRPVSAAPAPAAPTSKLPYVIIGILGAIILAGGAWLFTRGTENARTDSFETVRTGGSPAKTSTPSPAAAATPVNTPAPAVIPPPAPVRPRSSTVRVRFAKGAVTWPDSGSLSGGEVRNYVLACRAGQQLSADLSTSNGCAAFADGSTTLRGITHKGDNTITIMNKCDGSGNFTLNITII